MGGSGVQRPLKFAKYLPQFGWNPIILCPEPGVYHTFDKSLEEELAALSLEIHRVQGGGVFQKASRGKSQREVKIEDQAARKLRRLSRLFFYPDNKRGWIQPGFEKAMEIISSKKIDLIFSTAPPFSNHLLARRLKEETGIPLVVDYRDSWTNNHFQTELWAWQKQILRNQERKVVASSDKIICLDEFIRSDFNNDYPEISKRIEIIPHGFDPDDFETNIDATLDYKEGALNILYSGLFYEQNQPDTFFKAIHQLLEENVVSREKIHLHFQGGLDGRILQLLAELGLDKISTNYGYLSHRKAVSNILKADLLWMISNFDSRLKQIKSGKLFEYIGTGKPILGLVHESEASKLLRNYGSGFVARPDSVQEIRVQLTLIFKKWEERGLPQVDNDFVASFNRKSLTEKLAQIFNVIS